MGSMNYVFRSVRNGDSIMTNLVHARAPSDIFCTHMSNPSTSTRQSFVNLAISLMLNFFSAASLKTFLLSLIVIKSEFAARVICAKPSYEIILKSIMTASWPRSFLSKMLFIVFRCESAASPKVRNSTWSKSPSLRSVEKMLINPATEATCLYRVTHVSSSRPLTQKKITKRTKKIRLKYHREEWIHFFGKKVLLGLNLTYLPLGS